MSNDELINGLTKEEDDMVNHLLSKRSINICGTLPETQSKLLEKLLKKRSDYQMEKGRG